MAYFWHEKHQAQREPDYVLRYGVSGMVGTHRCLVLVQIGTPCNEAGTSNWGLAYRRACGRIRLKSAALVYQRDPHANACLVDLDAYKASNPRTGAF